LIPNFGAATSADPANATLKGLVCGLSMIATGITRGAISLSSSSHFARLCLSCRRARLVQSSGAITAAVDHHGGIVLDFDLKIHSLVTASRKSSTRIKAASSKARRSPAGLPILE
jgi:hypothetical protein